MSHRTWTTLASGLLLVAAAGAQDLSGGFGNTTFSPLTVVASAVYNSPPVVADFDEDGLPDAALQHPGTQDIALLFGQVSVGLGGQVLVPSGVSGFARVYAANVDGDGHQDLIVKGPGLAMTWLRGHGDGSFDAPLPAGPGPIYYGELLFGDADGDGRADLLVAQLGGQLGFRKGDGGGGFAGPIDLAATDTPTELLLHDLDDDGVLDIALLDFGQVEVLEGLGGGAFGPAQAWSSFATRSLDAADLNLDGTLDLVHGTTSNVATVLPGLGGLQFGAPQYVSMHPPVYDLTVADLDLDGVPDLLGSGLLDDEPVLIARRMGPDGPVGPSVAVAMGPEPLDNFLQAADFDGDSLPDVLGSAGWFGSKLGLVLNGLGPFIGLGHELPGPQGAPTLQLFGEPQAGMMTSLQVIGPPQPSMGILFVGLQPANIPFAGGLFVPDVLLGVGVPVSGQVSFANVWPAGIPAGTTLYLQAWFKSGSGALSASDAWLIVSE